METIEPPMEVVLKEWKNEFFGLELNGKKYVGKNFIIVRATKDTQMQTIFIELIEQWEQPDQSWEDFLTVTLVWFLSVEDFAKLRQFIDKWIKWCKTNDYSLEFPV